MGHYAIQSDLESFWGERNIAKWSNKDNDATTADTTAIASAITEAEEDVDNAFRDGVYALPFSPVPAKVKSWIVRLAGAALYAGRGLDDSDAEANKLKTTIDMVMSEMRTYLSGIATFSSSRAYGSPSGPTVIKDR